MCGLTGQLQEKNHSRSPEEGMTSKFPKICKVDAFVASKRGSTLAQVGLVSHDGDTKSRDLQ